jgi:CBS domain containing-hemolysin-like protein
VLLRWLIPAGARPAPGPTEEEYKELLELAAQQGALRPTEKDIILQIVALDHHIAKDVLRPRAEMVALPDDLPVPEMAAAARRLKHRRLPIYDGSLDTIVGVLDTQKLLLDPEGDFAEVVEMPSFVPETMNLLTLLKSLQRQRRGVAIVLDEFGSTAGLVTLEDIVSWMVGALRPEGATPGFTLVALGEGRWRANASLRLDDFRRVYPALGEVPDVDTLGGLVLAQAGVVPQPGEAVDFRGLRLEVTKGEDRRVRELLVTVERRKGKEGT